MQPLKLCDKHAVEELWAIITNMSNEKVEVGF